MQEHGLVSKNERLLLDILKEGRKQYSEIVDLLGKKQIKKRTANNLLKKLDGKKIFRIEKDGNVFYRLNDFPREIQLFLAFIDSYPDKDGFKYLLTQIKNDVIRLYPKMTFQQILAFWQVNLKALSEGDASSMRIFQKFKEFLE